MMASETKTNFHIRWMIRADMPSVLEVENASFDRPMIEDDFIRFLRNRNSIGFVIEDFDADEVSPRVFGYMIYTLERKAIHIASFAIHPNYRRRGAAKKIFDKMKGKLSKDRREQLVMLVSEYFTQAHLFLRSQGFMAVDVTESYLHNQINTYPGCDEVDEQYYQFNYLFDPEND